MRVVLTVAAALVAGVAMSSHHSFPAYYFEDQTVSIEGPVVEFALRAPHAWVYITALDADGQFQRFGAEWANPNRLSRDGITKTTIKVGDRVVITGSPGRTASEHTLHLKKIERPSDGWTWGGVQAGRGGRGGRGGRR
jgi:hypothetical protein